jgi:hypothetical protein
MEIREAFGNSSKKTGPSGTMRGSTFNADFAEEEQGNGAEDTGRGRAHNRKRAGTGTVEKEASPTKKTKNLKCPACDLKGHALQDCWIIFENKRPENYRITKASEARAKRAKEKVEQDKDLAAEVERIKAQEATEGT